MRPSQAFDAATAPRSAGTVHAELGTALHTIAELRLTLAALLKAAERLRDTPEHSGDDISDEAAEVINETDVPIRHAHTILAQTAG